MNGKHLLYCVLVTVALIMLAYAVFAAPMAQAPPVCGGDSASANTPFLIYEKVYGPIGKIYKLCIHDDGRFEIITTSDGGPELVRTGQLSRAQMEAAWRLAMRNIGACPLTMTGADSVTSRLIRRRGNVELGVLTSDKMDPQTSYDVASMEMILGDWRLDVVQP